MSRPVQYFSNDYLEECRRFTPEETIEFLENFRELGAAVQDQTQHQSKLISIKIPKNLLHSFRVLAQARGIPYQTLIKKLMEDWVKSGKPLASVVRFEGEE
jgi:predicted DNA binding CopG/RHH family protein